MWSCWWPYVESGSCATDKSVGTFKFKEYSNLSVISWSHRLWSFQSDPSGWKQCAYSVANVFSGNVAAQLRWGGKLCTRLEARRKLSGHFFLRRMCTRICLFLLIAVLLLLAVEHNPLWFSVQPCLRHFPHRLLGHLQSTSTSIWTTDNAVFNVSVFLNGL